MVRIFDGRLQVDYGQTYIECPETRHVSFEDSFRGQNNGLCGAASPGILFLLIGLRMGYVSFVIDVLDAPPPLDDTWEEIVEVSFAPISEKVILSEWSDVYVCDIPLLQEIYRVRYCARNMDLGNEINIASEDEPTVDFYSLTFWLADPAPDVVIKQTSQTAAYYHNSV